MTTRTDRKPTRPRRAALAPTAGPTDSPSTMESEAESDSRHSRARSKKNRPRKRHNHLREMESLLKRALRDGSRRRRRSRRRRPSSSEPSSSSADSSDSDSSLERVRRPKRRRRHRSPTHTLPPIPDKIRAKIIRGEFIDLSTLLPGNLLHAATQKREPHDHARSSRSYKQAVEITDFTAWLEAWSSDASVVASYFPTAAPRMFQCQQFLAGKSWKFKLNAWLQYDTEFRLRLSLSKSLRFEAVNSELWATCFPADSLVQCQSCFTCGSLSHFASACPFRKKPSSSFPGRFQGTYGQQGTSGRFEPRPYQDEPLKPGIQARLGAKPEPCGVYNDKGTCFRGHKCPYSHYCRHCGGPHPECGCPQSRI